MSSPSSPSPSPTEQVDIVNCADEVIGTLPRTKLRARDVIYRVNYILVFNAAGQVLVQQRTDSKDIYPGLLDFAAGGVVQCGESYAHSAARELAEELGITVPLAECFAMWFEDAARAPAKRTWGKVFSCVAEGGFTLQQSEVASVNFMTVEDALALTEKKVAPDSRQALLAYLL